MNVTKTKKTITIKDNGNTISYYISKTSGMAVKLNATLNINGKEKQFRGVVDFTTMTSSWVGKRTRMTEQIEELLNTYDTVANS